VPYPFERGGWKESSNEQYQPDVRRTGPDSHPVKRGRKSNVREEKKRSLFPEVERVTAEAQERSALRRGMIWGFSSEREGGLGVLMQERKWAFWRRRNNGGSGASVPWERRKKFYRPFFAVSS